MPIFSQSALTNLRVLDLSRVRAGPTCVRMLADFGADVIRIEPPPGVDPNDGMFADYRKGGDFQNLNRNKRGLTLNLKTSQGIDILHRLVKTADVVVENWRPDVKARLGMDYETLSALNPRVILASISGFGQDGPYAKRPGFDQIVQGMGGLMSLTGTQETGPLRAGIAVADSSTGLYAAIGILVALLEREHSGKGQWVHTNLLHSQIAMLDFQAARYLVEGDVPKPAGNNHPTAAPMGSYRAADGAFNLGVSGAGQWEALCRVLGHTEWLTDPRFESNRARVFNRTELNAALQSVFETDTVDHWVTLLNDASIPAGPIYSVPQLFEDKQVKHLRVVQKATTVDGDVVPMIAQPVTLARTPAQIVSAAPELGEHTDAILSELGFSPNAIAALRSANVV
ncbi:Acetyl-CoA:oxalate CoA-transferase [Ralstonia mannitolilytica]|uniref:CaiB/BaiF CoA transferase family protein n=1 Tax=Ralstonia mannitolilytica TaxID=105219 RepID=UPI0028F604C4|nr:CaiB/BaiF CoA-transferase family protein [Ralstonia mannitolilytica]CAJ0803814.1 Acetyl-CoA:oxalate CoA-transferase [Ralstonia mannitolilytica]